MGVEFERVEHEKVSVLKVSGNLDAATSKLLKRALANLIKEERYNIVVDMQKVVQINYMGVGTLLERLGQVRKLNGDLKLTGINRHIRAALALVQADKIFENYDSEDDAIASFAVHKESSSEVA